MDGPSLLHFLPEDKMINKKLFLTVLEEKNTKREKETIAISCFMKT